MGVMRFLVHSNESIDQSVKDQQAYVSGLDGHIFPSTTEWAAEENILESRRDAKDSGKFHIAWDVPGHGRPIIGTCTLNEREKPFILALELARGKLGQFREQMAAWEQAGMAVPESIRNLNRKAFEMFCQSASNQDDLTKATELATDSLSYSFQAAEHLVQSYAIQRLNARRRQRTARALLGCQLEGLPVDPSHSEDFKKAFHAANVSVSWKEIEKTQGEYDWDLVDQQATWCMENNLITRGGPLLDLSQNGLPDWLENWQNDYLNLLSFVCDFVETAVTRFTGKIRNWELASNANTGGALALNEEQRLTLVARILDVARQADEENQIFLGIAQPWGNYQAKGQHRLSPYQFVDALLRSGMGLSGVSLHFTYGYGPGGCGLHDLLDLSRLIDIWSSLGIPLHVTLAFPSSTQKSKLASSSMQVMEEDWKHPWNESAQAAWIDLVVPLLMAKQSVVGIFWNHYSDGHPHAYANGGVVREDGSFKSSYDRFVHHHDHIENH